MTTILYFSVYFRTLHFHLYVYQYNIILVAQYLASLSAQLVKNLPAMQETQFNTQIRKIPWRRDRLPNPIFLSFPGHSAGKESAHNVGDLGSIPWLGRSPGEGIGCVQINETNYVFFPAKGVLIEYFFLEYLFT